jgi:hypothetical protein
VSFSIIKVATTTSKEIRNRSIVLFGLKFPPCFCVYSSSEETRRLLITFFQRPKRLWDVSNSRVRPTASLLTSSLTISISPFLKLSEHQRIFGVPKPMPIQMTHPSQKRSFYSNPSKKRALQRKTSMTIPGSSHDLISSPDCPEILKPKPRKSKKRKSKFN